MIGSRRVGGHHAIHRQLERALEDVNGWFRSALWAPLGPTKGVDELSGALVSLEPAFDIVCRLNLLMHPLCYRFALGWGEVYSLAPAGGAGALDGNAFHFAAEGLERARRESIPLAFAGYASQLENSLKAVEALASLDHCVREDWTGPQIALARAMQDRPHATQSELARRSGRTQQAVSRAAVRGRFKLLDRAEQSIRQMLADMPSVRSQGPASGDGRC